MTQLPPPSPPAVVVTDADGVIRYWSSGAEVLTGHAATAAVGQSLDLIVPPDYRARHWDGFRAAMASGQAKSEGAAANIPLVCADGLIRRWPGRFTLIRDARGRVAGAAAVLVTPADGDPPLFDL
ncbi:MAG TPA: PAS domain-containing protein [Streptosporangiaceae bacterium]|nr:PAS domain-containing protein [Streptosporangiaceae bacterium]